LQGLSHCVEPENISCFVSLNIHHVNKSYTSS